MGVLICEILSGTTPFFDENPKKIYENVIRCKTEYGPGISAQVKELTNAIFVADAQARPSIEKIKNNNIFRVSNR